MESHHVSAPLSQRSASIHNADITPGEGQGQGCEQSGGARADDHDPLSAGPREIIWQKPSERRRLDNLSRLLGPD